MANSNFTIENGLVVLGNIAALGGIDKLTTTSGNINIAALAPAAGQVLTASSATVASWVTPGNSMVYPAAGIPNSSGSAWLTSYNVTGTGNVVLDIGATITGATITGATTIGATTINTTNLTSTNTITGNITGSAATVTSAAQPAITSVGTLSGLTVTSTINGNITGSASYATTAGNLAAAVLLPSGTTAATQSSGDNTTKIATTAFVHSITDLLVTGVSSFNTRTGNITLTSLDVTGALTYTPLNKAGDTMSGNLAMSSNQILGLTAIPLGPDAAASKAYVDALVSTSATWISPIADPDLNDVVAAVPGSPVAGATYIAYGGSYPQNWGTGANAVVSGDIVSYKQDASAWLVIKNLTAGDRLILAGEHGAVSATLLTNGFFKGDIAQYVSGNPALTASWTFPNGRGQGGTPEIAQGTTTLVDISTGEHYGHTYLYDATGNNWIEIAGPGSIGAGIGLSYSGNILNVNLGAGIAQLPSDEVGIDVYIGGGLMTTLDGTTSNTTTAAQLSLTNVGTAGTYTSVTTDTYGRVTAGSNPTPSLASNLVGGSAGVVPYQSATSTTLFTAVGVAGNVLISGGAGTPTWTSAPTFSSVIVTGTLTGNVTGYASNVITNANLTGDVTSTGNATTLATVNATTGQFGSTITVPQFTVNAKGLITAAANVSIAFPAQVYPGAGFAYSTGSAWSTSYAATGTGNVVLDTGATLTASNLTVSNTITGSVSGSAATVTAAAQPAITSVGTLSGLTVTSPITGNIIGSATTASTVTTAAQPAITSVGTLTGLTTSGDVTVGGNLVVLGVTTTVDSQTVSVTDINIVLGNVAVPSNVTAVGGGITLLGTTDKTISWVSPSVGWQSSEVITAPGFVGPVTGTLTGNITGSAATVTSAAQPAITSVGTLSGLTVTSTITGNITGSAATVTSAAQPAITSVGTLTGLTVSGTISTNGNLALTSGAPITANETGTSFANVAVAIDSFNSTLYRSAKYVVSVTNGSTYQVSEVLITHNGTTAYSVAYGEVSTTGTPFITFTSGLTGSTVYLYATGASAGNTAKVLRMYVAV